MTDTDDTDDLLLIPPDFFVVESDSEQSNIDPYYSVVDSLIEQVSNLQNRIKSIESSESFLSNSPNNSFNRKTRMQKHIKEFRKYNSSDDIYVPSSTQSTPQRPHTKFKINSLPASPYVDKFNHNRNYLDLKSFSSPNRPKPSPSSPVDKGDSSTISEVDTFLSKVKTIQRLNAARNLENDFNLIEPTSKNLQKEQSQCSSEKLQGDILEAEVAKEQVESCGNNKNSVPDYGLGIRDQMYRYQENRLPQKEEFSDIQTGNDRDLSNEYHNLSSVDRFPDSESTSDSFSQVTAFKKYSKTELLKDPIHTNALNILNMHKQLTENSAKKTSKIYDKDHRQKKANHSGVNDNLGLLSLADIWSSTSSQMLHSNPSQIIQKLQEEKLRRKHCEDLIHDLQNKNLELQQKLSVAVKVDESKNITIGQFQESLQKLLNKMQVLQREKREWENERSRMKNRHSNEMKENSEKIQYYEKEMSKALNMAHSNHEKISLLEKNCGDLQNENQSLKKIQKDLEDLLSLERNRNKELADNINRKEIELAEIKETLNMTRYEIDKTNRTIGLYQEDFSKMKTEADKLQQDLKDSNAQVRRYEEERNQLFTEMEECRQKENKLKEEIASMKKQLDQNKVDLRNYYQGQMEVLVQNKLKEFQSQLDKSEGNFKERELAIAKTAAVHIQQMSEKYSIEIQLIEKKHQEELKLYQVKLMQYKQQCEDLQSKLNHIQDKRVSIAKQLQKIMETQWAEALRIIANGKSSPSFNNEESFSTIDQLNTLKTKSYNNLEEILTKHVTEHFNGEKENKGTSNAEERNQGDDLKLSMETPVSSRSQGNKHYNEHEIQKYVNLFLNRPANEGPSRQPDAEINYDTLSWLNDRGDGTRSGKQHQKERRGHKPPWK